MGPTLIKHDPRLEVFRASPAAAYMREYFCPLLEKTCAMRAQATGTMDAVFMAATILFGDTRAALRGRRKTHPLVHHRQMVMAAAIGLGRLSYPQIGRAVEAHHTTILYAVKRVAAAHDWAWEKEAYKARCREYAGLDISAEAGRPGDQAVWQICSAVSGLAYGVDPLRLRYPGRDAKRDGAVRHARMVALALLCLARGPRAGGVAYADARQLKFAQYQASELKRSDPVFKTRFDDLQVRMASMLNMEVAA